MTTRILIVEDHAVVRQGIAALLREHADFEVVGQAGDGWAAVRMAVTLSPDVVVMDVTLPQLNGIDATRRIVGLRPATRVVALSMHAEEHVAAEMQQAGAAAFLLKDCAAEELATAIRRVTGGTNAAAGAAATKGTGRRRAGRERTGLGLLSSRERQVLQLIAEGRNMKQIAADLGISPKTVETHRARLVAKLKVRGVADLTRLAIRAGITPLEKK